MNLPDVLYKFRQFDTNCLRLLERSSVFYADPRSFNDPLDCDPTVGNDSSLDELERVLIGLVVSNSREKSVSGESKVDEINYCLSQPIYAELPDERRKEIYVNAILHNIGLELKSHFGGVGVLSLSGSWKSVLMWSHYASNHAGICVGFKSLPNACENILPVDYSLGREIPSDLLVRWRLDDSESAREEIWHRFFYAKSSSWHYEDEWRDLARPTDSMPSGVGVRDIPFEICEIVFGLRCDYSVLATIIRLHEKNRKTIRFFKAHTRDRSFELARDELDPDEYLSASPSGSLVLAMQRLTGLL